MTDISVDNNGLKLATSVIGNLDAPAILFLHGISMSRDTWEETVQRLADRFAVWTMDFRGHGHSDRASGYDITDYVSDGEAALSAIGKPTVIVGHSLGACVAGVLAQSGDDKVRAAFLEDPPWYLGEAAEWKQSAFPRLFSIVSERQTQFQTRERVSWHLSELYIERTDPNGRNSKRPFQPTALTKPRVRVAAPRRAMLGQRDGCRRRRNACGRPNKRPVQMSGEGHTV